MKITLDALVVLDAIDRCGTFATAAVELHRVPSSLSYLVQKLESDLGVTVFDRSGHRARLTCTGRTLLDEGRRLLRAADELECRAKRVESGWEAELHIALDATVSFRILLPYISAFYDEVSHTRLRFSHEVLGGTWDAILSGRADLAIGAVGDPPPMPGYTARSIGSLDTVFAVAPGHPLADAPEPVARAVVAQHRAVVIGDTSRMLPPRNLGLLEGQDALTVPNLIAKLEAQLAGLGCGFLPRCLIEDYVAGDQLVIKKVEEMKPPQVFYYLAWHTGGGGLALDWWINQIMNGDFFPSLVSALEPRGVPQQNTIHAREVAQHE